LLTPGRLNDGTLPTRQLRNGSNASREPIEYGLGLVFGAENGRRYATHEGVINGFQGELKSWVTERVSVACLVNIDAGPVGSVDENTRAMAAMIAEGARIALA